MAATTETMTETLTLADDKALTFAFNANKNQNDEKDFLLDVNTLLRRAEAGRQKELQSMDASISEVNALLLVGIGYHQGRFGFPVNVAEAEKWLKEAKVREDVDAGCCALAYCFEHGLAGKEVDIVRATGNYSGSQRKCLPAKFLYVSLSYFDHTEDDNLGKMSNYLMECVEQGFVPAIAFLGERHLTDGWCVEVDKEKGLKLLKSAAEQGDAPSKFLLGEVYSKGLHGVGKDLSEAKKWYRLALEQNHPGAEQALQHAKKGCTIM